MTYYITSTDDGCERYIPLKNAVLVKVSPEGDEELFNGAELKDLDAERQIVSERWLEALVEDYT